MNNEYTQIAYERGRTHGAGEASWMFDGNTTVETYRTFLRLYDNCDLPDEYCPRNALSGEWAGESPTELIGDLFDMVGDDEFEKDAICEAYETGYREGWYDHLCDVAIYHTQDLDTTQSV